MVPLAPGSSSQVDPPGKHQPQSQRVLRRQRRRPALRPHRLPREGLKSAASPGDADTHRHPGLPSHVHPPSRGSSPPVRRRGRPRGSRPSRPGPERAGRLHRRPSRAPQGSDRGGGGGGRHPPRLGKPGRGAGSEPGLPPPPPQAGANPYFPPRTPTDKRPTAGDPHPQPGPAGGRSRGVSLPGASALRSAPGPWAPPPDRRTAGQWAPGWGSGRPGRALRDRSRQAEGQLRAQAESSEQRGGAADGQSQRQTDGRRGKRWRRGRRERAARAPQRATRVHEPPSPARPPPARSPLPAPGARPGRGRGLGGGERGSREAGLTEGASNPGRPRGA